MIRFVQRHRTMTRLIGRGPVKAWISRRVWADLEADPAFVEGVKRGQADFAAGRTYLYDPTTGILTPNPAWPPDGEQPKPPHDFVTGQPVESVP